MEQESDSITEVSEVLQSENPSERLEHAGIEMWLDEFGDDESSSVRVYREVGQGRKDQTFLFAFSGADYSFVSLCEKLRDEFGGGRFRIKAYVKTDNPRSKNKMVLALNRVINIVEKKQETDSSPNKANIDPGISAVLDEIRRSNERMMEMQLKLQQVNSGGGFDIEKIVTMISAAAPIISTLREVLVPPPPAHTVDPIESASRVVGLMRDLDIGGGDGKNTAEVILEGIKTVGAPLVEAMSRETEEVSVPQVATQVAESQKLSVISKPKQKQSKKGGKMLSKLLSDIKRMVAAARKGADPGLYADLIISEYSEQQVAQLANDKGLIDKAEMFVDGVREHRKWFDDVHAMIVHHVSNLTTGGDDDLSLSNDSEGQKLEAGVSSDEGGNEEHL